MCKRFKKAGVSALSTLIVLFLATSVYAEIKVGWLVDLTAHDSKITIDEALDYPEKKYMTYVIEDDAKWHICTEKACILKKGSEGYGAFKEAVDAEAYGRPYRSFRVVLDAKKGKVRALEIQITTKMH